MRLSVRQVAREVRINQRWFRWRRRKAVGAVVIQQIHRGDRRVQVEVLAELDAEPVGRRPYEQVTFTELSRDYRLSQDEKG